MKDWTKINSFNRIEQAELRKQILKDNGINSIILKKKDSAFLWGEIELYVENDKLELARELIDEFRGWTKVNSFSRLKQVVKMQELLDNAGFETLLLKKEDIDYLIDDFELHVKNEEAEKAKQFIQQLYGWKQVAASDWLPEIVHRAEMLDQKKIDCIIVKTRNEDFQIEEVAIYVQDADNEQATEYFQQLTNWTCVDTRRKERFAKIHAELLERDLIPVIIKENDTSAGYDLYVPDKKYAEAKECVENHRNWQVLYSFPNAYQADMLKMQLEQTGIESIILQKRDSSFLWGEVEIYVEDENLEDAQNIIKELSEIE